MGTDELILEVNNEDYPEIIKINENLIINRYELACNYSLKKNKNLILTIIRLNHTPFIERINFIDSIFIFNNFIFNKIIKYLLPEYLPCI